MTEQPWKWKVGDWCFCEFELNRIEDVADDGRVTSVSTGSITHGGYDLSDRCFPLTKDIKRFSDSVSYWSKTLHATNAPLNFPDIHRKFVEMWVEGCEQIEDKAAIKAAYEAVDDFATGVRRALEDARSLRVADVKVMR